tara:strand:+ start:553 stop:780 length:228 start_codon:yes stop_codon:yes gene_type:complete
MDINVTDSLSTLFPQVIKIEKIGHDIMPKVSISTPIGSIEADYGNPLVDGTVIVLVLGGLYIVKKIIDKIRSDES